jgi:adenine C2-methylase RlmN of 23S rRNA A2503 and tRNA A37
MLVVTEPNHKFNIEQLLNTTEEYLRSTDRWGSIQQDWGLVKQVNLAFTTALSTGWKAENIEESLIRSFGWDDNDMTRRDAYQGQCTTLQALKPA